ncbi:hypothetical protein JM84_2440 [Dokdonia sp. Hel_I_63]|uniref:hypothetical protein n=1 Tax=Dokdonia sp. Hel_I_63 TaxID=1249996 RepID=UPI00119B8370|nr:hypothetical protein [Dokdonia sp. Hel_I_63]TVZ23512.1 hypothetical protein JM84_2440 [Dokdonia sp. Hel_I_63]
MEFHHNKEYEELVTGCPPANYIQKNLSCFRWVFSELSDQRNFLSQADKNPKVLNNKSDSKKCDYYALSFHDSEANSQKHFDYLSTVVKNAKKRLGTHIAQGIIKDNDGLAGEIENNGHFNFHFAKKNELKSNFKIIRPL